MRKRTVLTITFTLFFSLTLLSPQLKAQDENEKQSCKVLLEPISDIYKGDCKKGLAHGKGVAKGEDTYIGKFKKGLPHGKGKYITADSSVYEGKFRKGKRDGYGIYTYINDGKKMVLKGIWQDGKFDREVYDQSDYNILQTKSVERVNIYRGGDLNDVRIVFKRAGSTSDVSDLQLYGSSGVANMDNLKRGFENVEFPFKGTVRYKALNKLNLNPHPCMLEFEILRPGTWIVEISY